MKRKGRKIVLGEVHNKRASAIPFYYRHDFRITGFVQDFFGIEHNAIVPKLVLK